MSDKSFVDSNVLIYAYDNDAGVKSQTVSGGIGLPPMIYAYDNDAGVKRAAAAAVLRDLWTLRSGALSTQVLYEFYVNVTRKIATPLSKSSARAVVDAYAPWCVTTTPAETSAAFRIEDEAQISFWDALIVAAARKAGAVRILSEDLNAGQTIAGIRIENPFSG